MSQNGASNNSSMSGQSTPPSSMSMSSSSGRSIPPRPPPSRQGAPASTRNFKLSSAGGAPGPSKLAQRKQRLRVGAAAVRGKLSSERQLLELQHSDETSEDDMDRIQRNKQDAWGDTYNAREETLRNDYSTHYVQTGERPQNHIRGASVSKRFEEYPKLASLLEMKHALTESTTNSIPPTYFETGGESLVNIIPNLVPHRFDVILLSPPADTPFDELLALDPSRLAATPGFVWLWVGSGARGDGIGLEKGRELLAAWGYRRSEDIVWLKTNKANPGRDLTAQSSSLLTPTVEHCLMGIRGTVRRSNDPWFVHCNVDTDVIVWEGDDEDPALKPPELQSLIENFCLGTRRLHLYGSPKSLRRGWLTVGSTFAGEQPEIKVTPVEGEKTIWQAERYDFERFQFHWSKSSKQTGSGQRQVSQLLPFNEELDSLRPKSPPPRNGQPSSGGLGRGRGAGLGVTRSGAANALSLRMQTVPMGPQSHAIGPLQPSIVPPPPPPPAPPNILAAQQQYLAMLQHQVIMLQEHQARQAVYSAPQVPYGAPAIPGLGPSFDEVAFAHQFAAAVNVQNSYPVPVNQHRHPHQNSFVVPPQQQHQYYSQQYVHPHHRSSFTQPPSSHRHSQQHHYQQQPYPQQSVPHFPHQQHHYQHYPIGGPGSRFGSDLISAQVEDAPEGNQSLR